MIDGIFVPDASSVENENLLALTAPPDHLAIKHEDVPKQVAEHVAVVNLFQRMDVHEELLLLTQEA